MRGYHATEEYKKTMRNRKVCIEPGTRWAALGKQSSGMGCGRSGYAASKSMEEEISRMKITDVKTFLVHDPVRPGRNYTFVKVYTDEGLTGLGEAGITWKELAIQGLVETYKPILVGMDPSRIEHIWQTLWRGQFFRGGHIHAATVAAIDIALWDLRGKALGVPVYDLLGGKTRDYARCYCHVQRRGSDEGGRRAGIDAMVAYAKQQVADGWQFVRFGVGEGGTQEEDGIYEQARAMRWTVDAFTALRDALGPDIEIAVDFHQRVTPTYAIQIARALEPMRPFFIEDPLRAENAAEFRYLRQHINAPIATGEQLASKWDWQVLIEESLMDYCRVDLCICGGLTEAKKIAAWCETHYIEQAPHNPLGPGEHRRVPALRSLHAALCRAGTRLAARCDH